MSEKGRAMDLAGIKRTVNPFHDESYIEEVVTEKKNGNYMRNALVGGLGVVFLMIGAFLIGMESTGNASSEAQPEASEPIVAVDPRTVFVQLFEWKWTDIEKECVNYLGPKGFSAVQVSPPNEHTDHRKVQDYAWWARYQPVTYDLVSRSGNRQEFISMVQTCKNVGVDIYVDAIINHVAVHEANVGVNGSPYSKATRTYPFYSGPDFNYCDPPEIQGSDYSNNAYRVRHCELNGLPDLNHDSAYVRSKIVAYLQDLIDIGVAGFRFDASKHMEPRDVEYFATAVSGNPYVFLEVIDNGGESISYLDYNLQVADVTEFKYTSNIGNIFANGQLTYLNNFGSEWGMMDQTNAVVFVDNHDNQRGHGNAAQVTHRSGALYDITNVFMLAHPYGYPKVMSSYDWGGSNDNLGPPNDGFGNTKDVYNGDGSLNCFGNDWICEHRWRPIGNMVAFRNYVTGQSAFDITNWWSNGGNQIAFSRSGPNGAAGFVVINREGFDINQQSFLTGLPDGVYCDVIAADFDPTTRACAGPTVTVSGGWANLSVKSIFASAFYGGSKLN